MTVYNTPTNDLTVITIAMGTGAAVSKFSVNKNPQPVDLKIVKCWRHFCHSGCREDWVRHPTIPWVRGAVFRHRWLSAVQVECTRGDYLAIAPKCPGY